MVGGVSELFQSDLDLGRLAVERLHGEDLGVGVVVEDLHYGAVTVAQRLQDLRPVALILVGAVPRGRAPGTVQRRRFAPPQWDPARVQAAVSEAVTGYVGIDLVVDVAGGFGVLPARTVTIEVEPERVESGEGLTATAASALDRAVELVRWEVQQTPMLELAESLRVSGTGSTAASSPAEVTLGALLSALAAYDRDGGWGPVFALRDRLRHEMITGCTGDGMEKLDWGLWWVLIEELDRLQRVEVSISAWRDRSDGS